MENKTPAEEMTREGLLYELAGHAHPLEYHSLLSWSFAELAALLTWYRARAKGDATPPVIRPLDTVRRVVLVGDDIRRG